MKERWLVDSGLPEGIWRRKKERTKKKKREKDEQEEEEEERKKQKTADWGTPLFLYAPHHHISKHTTNKNDSFFFSLSVCLCYCLSFSLQPFLRRSPFVTVFRVEHDRKDTARRAFHAICEPFKNRPLLLNSGLAPIDISFRSPDRIPARFSSIKSNNQYLFWCRSCKIQQSITARIID